MDTVVPGTIKGTPPTTDGSDPEAAVTSTFKSPVGMAAGAV
jgi:hypothetical protein